MTFTRGIKISLFTLIFSPAPALFAQDTVTGADSELPAMDCIVEPSEIVELGSGVAGIIASLAVERNDFVEADAVVATLDARVERASLELATARAELNTSLKLRRENAAFGRRTQQRNEELFQESSISEQDMDRVKTETYIAQLQAKQEEDNKLIAKLEAVRAGEALEQRTIRSPIAGVVMERYKAVGEYLEAEPVYKIARLDPLSVELIIPVAHLGTIKRGMQAELQLEVSGKSEEQHVATVKSVDKVADAASGTFGVKLSLPNSGYRIPGGVRCSLEFLPEMISATE